MNFTKLLQVRITDKMREDLELSRRLREEERQAKVSEADEARELLRIQLTLRPLHEVKGNKK